MQRWEEYIPSPAHSTMQHGVKAGTSLRVVDYAQRGRELYIAYGAENRDNVHGILCLEQGWNGKYQPVSASENPFPYTAGVWGETRAGGRSGAAISCLPWWERAAGRFTEFWSLIT